MLHLHRLYDDEDVSRLDRVAHGDPHGEHLPWHRSLQGAFAFGRRGVTGPFLHEIQRPRALGGRNPDSAFVDRDGGPIARPLTELDDPRAVPRS